MKLFKLTDENMQTHSGCQWALGEWKETSGEGELCGPGWLHAYPHPLLAILLNPIHAGLENYRLFEAEGAGNYLDDRGLKCGISRLRLVAELPSPIVTLEQRVEFGIRCALTVCENPTFIEWATKWLSGDDRSVGGAEWAAARAAECAARAARAARAAEWAALAAECAARAAWAAAWAAARAAEWAARAAECAARAARAAKKKQFDLIAIAEKAINELEIAEDIG